MARRKRRRRLYGAALAAHNRARKPRRRRRHRLRANPTPLLLANPHKRRHRKHRARRASPRIVLVRNNPMRRRRRRGRVRLNPRSVRHLRRHRRRSNPTRLRLGSFRGLLGTVAFGAVGVMSARAGSFLYNKFLAKTILEVNKTLSDVARLVVMGATTIGVEHGLRKARVSPAHCLAVKYGGLGETGRQALALVVGKLAPQFKERGYVGLDGLGLQYGYMDPSVLGGLEPASTFDGLEPASAFDGVYGPAAGAYGAQSYRFRPQMGHVYGDD